MHTNPLASSRAVSLQPSALIGGQRASAKDAAPTIQRRAGGVDSVVLSREALAARAASGFKQSANALPVAAKSTPAPNRISAGPDVAPRTIGQQDLDLVRSLFGATKNEERFNNDADFDGNGIIDFKDVTHVLSRWGQTQG